MEQPIKQYDITAAILAGGKNTRFSGRTKAKIIIDGQPMIERIIKVLERVFNDIVIIANNENEFSDYGHIRITGDIYPDIGPLGGLHSALTNTNSKAVFLVASDMPELNAEVIRHVVDNFNHQKCEALIPDYKGYIEPLHAIYKRDVLERLESFIRTADNYSIREFLKLVDYKYLVIDNIEGVSNPFVNINSPEDLQKWY
ncbi:MAG: molybdenum cofactor guanylyltransferase [Bacteroidota bacterium]|nr:molybdenum cofactor guanylyltransferase [Bacteroidota bacterium]